MSRIALNWLVWFTTNGYWEFHGGFGSKPAALKAAATLKKRLLRKLKRQEAREARRQGGAQEGQEGKVKIVEKRGPSRKPGRPRNETKPAPVNYAAWGRIMAENNRLRNERDRAEARLVTVQRGIDRLIRDARVREEELHVQLDEQKNKAASQSTLHLNDVVVVDKETRSRF